MSREVAILREVVVKLTPMIAGRGVKVTQQGAQAFVQHDARTGQIVRVNIPHIPDDADAAFLLAIQGFIDHEVGHILDTDWKAIAEAKPRGAALAKRLGRPEKHGAHHVDWLQNAVEDPFVEKRMQHRFPGAVFNLDRLHGVFLERITERAMHDPDVKGNAAREFAVLLIVVVRSWAKQARFTEYMDKKGYWKLPAIAELLARTPPALRERICNVKTSWDSLACAEALYEIIYPEVPPPPPAPPPPSPSKESPSPDAEEGEDSESSPKKSDGKGSPEDKPEDEDDKGADGEASKDEADDEKDDVADSDEAAEDKASDDAEAESKAPPTDELEGDRDDAAGEEDSGAGEDTDDDKASEPAEGEGSESGDGSDDSDAGDDDGEPDGDSDSESEDGADTADADGSSGKDESDEETEKDAEGADGDGEGKSEGEPEDSSDAAEDGAVGGETKDSLDDEESGESVDGTGSGEPEPAKEEEGGEFVEADAAEDGPSGKGSTCIVPIISEDEELNAKALAEAIAAELTDEASKNCRDADYRVFTRDWDVIAPHKVSKRFDPSQLKRLDDETRHMVAPMQKEIERMMAARSQVINVPGQRSGRLHGGSLHRLMSNDDRVFRKRQENKSTATAVTLLIDNSGSMRGPPVETAMAAGYALSQTLERVKIVHEVIGFTTKSPSGDQMMEIRKEVSRLGTDFSRVEPLYMPIYKGFDERLTPEVRNRFADAPHGVALMNNVDGECVRVAAGRLMMRREPRRVLIVLSDGSPACATSHPKELYADLHRAVAEATKAKIETIGIGIMDISVKTFYPKHIVLNNLQDLPKLVMGELKRILMAV